MGSKAAVRRATNLLIFCAQAAWASTFIRKVFVF